MIQTRYLRLFLLFILATAATVTQAKPSPAKQKAKQATALVPPKIPVSILVDANYHPYSFVENNKLKGIYTTLLRAIFKKLERYQVTLVPVDWEKGKRMIRDGEALALTPVFFHGHDWPYMYPYSLPYFLEKISVFCTQKVMQKKRQQWPEDFRKLKIGNVEGYDGWVSPQLGDLANRGEINLYEIKSSKNLVRMLINSRLDCILMEENAMRVILHSVTAPSVEPVSRGPLSGFDPVYIGYSKKALQSDRYPWSTAFRQAFDVTLYKMQKSGEIQAIIERYFKPW